MKTLLLLALASIKRVGDLHAFSVDNSCLQFGPVDSQIILRPRPGYVPKVPTTPFRDQVVSLQVMPPEEDPALALLCPVRALRHYVEAVVSVSGSQEGLESHGRINFGPHSSSLSPAGSSGRFESVIKGYSRTLCQIMEAGKRAPHTQTPPRPTTGQVPAFHLASLLRVRRWSRWSHLYGVWVPGAAQPSRWLLRTI